VQRIAAIRTPTKEDETKGIAMTNPTNPADGAAQPSVDERTVPSPNPPGSDTPPPQRLPEGPGIGAGAWPSEQTTAVGHGEQTAGGTDPDHPHLFHLADWPDRQGRDRAVCRRGFRYLRVHWFVAILMEQRCSRRPPRA
jgi:hypothetical protein